MKQTQKNLINRNPSPHDTALSLTDGLTGLQPKPYRGLSPRRHHAGRLRNEEFIKIDLERPLVLGHKTSNLAMTTAFSNNR
jgi:hypothetical protein